MSAPKGMSGVQKKISSFFSPKRDKDASDKAGGQTKILDFSSPALAGANVKAVEPSPGNCNAMAGSSGQGEHFMS